MWYECGITVVCLWDGVVYLQRKLQININIKLLHKMSCFNTYKEYPGRDSNPQLQVCETSDLSS